jgi:hypothetical protein
MGARLILVPVLKQLSLQRQQLSADFRNGALSFGDGDQATIEMGP